MPLAAVAAIGAIGSVAGSAIASHGANSAASTQADAALQAAQIQAQENEKALALQEKQFNVQQQNIAPWLQIGRGGLANLAYLSGLIPPSSTTAGTTSPVTTSQGRPGTQVPLNTGQLDGRNLPSPYSSDFPLYGGGSNPNGYTNLYGLSNLGANAPSTATPATSGTAGMTTSPVDLSSMVNPNLGAPGSLLAPWTQQFTAPTDVTEQNDPGYQFRLNEGEKALERSAAARGDILSGGTAKAIQKYGQDYASNEYGNVYNRALQQYQQNYNIFQNNQSNTFNRLAALAGIGQTATGELNSAAQNLGNNGANILINSGNAQAQGINNAAAARASGYAAGGNIWGGALNGMTNNLSNLYLLSQLQNQNATPTNTAGVGVFG